MALRGAERRPGFGGLRVPHPSLENLPPPGLEGVPEVTPGSTLQFSFFSHSYVQLPEDSPHSFLPQVDEGGRTPLSFHHFFAADDQDSLPGDAVIRLSALPKYGCIENTGTGTSRRFAVEFCQT